jgi:3-dehydroquinate synthase
MKTIKVKSPSKKYDVFIGAGILPELGIKLRRKGFAGKAVIITNPVVNEIYGNSLKTELTVAGLEASILLVPDGEKQKSLETAGMLYKKLTALGADRMTSIIALGGGVIGDLAGFVAATYLRGLPLVQVPTTLLAQVDSSIGGKVAVNYEHIKNKIGAFYQPEFVLSDIQTLRTLPREQLNNGMAEIIKYAVIRDRSFFSYIEGNMEKIKSLDEQALEKIIARSAEIKADIVCKDERDTGLRNILNYGHTAGHAIESTADFNMGHGQAVAMGMIIAGRIALNRGLLKQEEFNSLRDIILTAGLPADLTGPDTPRIIEAVKQDKKIIGGKIRFILAKSIGNVIMADDISIPEIEKALAVEDA